MGRKRNEEEIGGDELPKSAGTDENGSPMAFVVGPENTHGSLSWNGTTYEADSDGVFTVPAAALADLAGHGFTQA